MCDEWMPLVQLPLTPAQFAQLPRNAAYRYDYDEGRAWLNPRPRFYHALIELPLPSIDGTATINLQGIDNAGDWDPLVELFAEAFQFHRLHILDKRHRMGVPHRHESHLQRRLVIIPRRGGQHLPLFAAQSLLELRRIHRNLR